MAPRATPGIGALPSEEFERLTTDAVVAARLARIRDACQALAIELASARRQLRTAEAELAALKSGESAR